MLWSRRYAGADLLYSILFMAAFLWLQYFERREGRLAKRKIITVRYTLAQHSRTHTCALGLQLHGESNVGADPVALLRATPQVDDYSVVVEWVPPDTTPEDVRKHFEDVRPTAVPLALP